MEKICIGCKQEKLIEQFSWKVKSKGYRQSYCKTCESENSRRYRQENRERLNDWKRTWKKENPDKVREAGRGYAARHPEILADKSRRYRERNPDVIATYNKKYRKENAEFVAALKRVWAANNRERENELRRERLAENLKDKEFAARYRLNLRMANSINRSLSGNKNGAEWGKLVGYTLEELMGHLEAAFSPGMTWENRGSKGWHIDHIKPIASFSFTSPNDVAFRECWAIENLQPLWWRDNLKKGAQVTLTSGLSY